jgi:hypothetical protein
MATREGTIQIAPESTGKYVRNIIGEVVQDDGSVKTVSMQVVNLRDEDGEIIHDFNEMCALLRGILGEISALRRMYGRATGMQFIGLNAMADSIGDVGGE